MPKPLSLLLMFTVAACVAACGAPSGPPGPAERRVASEWRHYGHDAGGQRFVALDGLTRDNVAQLEMAWSFHTGDVSSKSDDIPSESAFEGTPLLVNGLLYLCSPFNKVFALDPQTGAEKWRYDPQVDIRGGRYANQLICRGVSYWESGGDGVCARRLFMGTNDARLIALDADTGLPCAEFAGDGSLDLLGPPGDTRWKGEYQVTSPPAISGDVVVVGSAISDNNRITAPSGLVRGFDARTGKTLWAWDLAPPDFVATPENTSADGFALGTPNVWAPMSVDAERDLVFLPTGNAAPDYYRGERASMNHFGSSVVALRGATGERVWHFATVHNDLWDYDVPAQPVLTQVRRDGVDMPVVVQATKMGLLFVLHRETGEPVFGVEERPVPQNGAAGERLSPTQPFPLLPPPLVPHTLKPEDAWGLTPWDRGACRDLLASLRFEGIYTPPTEQGTLMYPGNAGGSNWGGVAVDPERGILVANVMDLPFYVKLWPRAEWEKERAAKPKQEMGPQTGTPFGLSRNPALSPLGLPCNPPPWGKLVAVDLNQGKILWEEPFGTVRDIAPVPIPWKAGVPSLGGPIVTRSGLILIAASMDDYIRAFDIQTGEELWKARLPAGGQATPMAYEIAGKPYVLIAAGGHARGGTKLGDELVAFRLPDR